MCNTRLFQACFQPLHFPAISVSKYRKNPIALTPVKYAGVHRVIRFRSIKNNSQIRRYLVITSFNRNSSSPFFTLEISRVKSLF